jgi:mannose-6-phosphate isomerase-like protein (cupin superfamily)
MNMSDPTNDPQSPIRERVERFIDAVDYALASGGMGADERQNIVADLREQIEEMLSDRARHSGKPVAIEDVESVLAELDPPESYTEAGRTSEAETPVHAGPSCEGRQRHHGAGAFHRGGPRWFWGKRRVAQAVRQAMRSLSPFGHPAFVGMTERTRTAVALAKSEAQRMRHDFIGTEHLLLGLILEGTGLAAKVLADLGFEREWARQEASRLVGPGTADNMHVRLPLTPRARRAIEEARLAARNLGHDYLGTEHLLLGLLDGEGVAAQIIANRGLTAAQVRAEILKRIPSAPGQSDAANPAVGTVATGSFTYWPARAIHEIKIGENSYKIVATSGDTGAAYTSIEAVIASPDGLGCRTHTREDISLYVLDGSIRLRIGDRTVDVGKGDFARIPRGIPHEIQPTAQPARIMLIATPAGLEKLIGELARTPGIDQQREAARRYGVTSE